MFVIYFIFPYYTTLPTLYGNHYQPYCCILAKHNQSFLFPYAQVCVHLFRADFTTSEVMTLPFHWNYGIERWRVYTFSSFNWLPFMWQIWKYVTPWSTVCHIKKKKKFPDPAQVRAPLELFPLTQAGNGGGFSWDSERKMFVHSNKW